MTEELEKEADNYAEKHAFRVPYDGSNKFYDDVDFKASKEGYLAGAEPREKQIQIDAEQIRALQKQNGELTDELTLTNNECKDMREELKQRIRENQKLCEQIEKMKNCFNCKHSRTEYEHCRTNKHEKWEIKEK